MVYVQSLCSENYKNTNLEIYLNNENIHIKYIMINDTFSTTIEHISEQVLCL